MSKYLSVKTAGQRGGIQRAKNLSPPERSAIARMGGLARQKKRLAQNNEKIPVDSHSAKR